MQIRRFTTSLVASLLTAGLLALTAGPVTSSPSADTGWGRNVKTTNDTGWGRI